MVTILYSRFTKSFRLTENKKATDFALKGLKETYGARDSVAQVNLLILLRRRGSQACGGNLMKK